MSGEREIKAGLGVAMPATAARDIAVRDAAGVVVDAAAAATLDARAGMPGVMACSAADLGRRRSATATPGAVEAVGATPVGTVGRSSTAGRATGDHKRRTCVSGRAGASRRRSLSGEGLCAEGICGEGAAAAETAGAASWAEAGAWLPAASAAGEPPAGALGIDVVADTAEGRMASIEPGIAAAPLDADGPRTAPDRAV
ncbi:hypothetical protein [Cellulomonas timonensis]|uniref:hypothetical protein n=1 Tax=Cellulomonas timonensis TaxID=1689271 RepID=UPI00082F2121|nr:hypothetical protein [Cellulomonas timonensis]